MKKILLFTMFSIISSVSFAQTNQVVESEKAQVQIKCEEAQKDKKNKNLSMTSTGCSFNRMFGSSHCEGLGGAFKKAIFSAGTCTIGETTE